MAGRPKTRAKRGRRRRNPYESEAELLYKALKKDWRYVTFNPKTQSGTAQLGSLDIAFYESSNDSAVIVNITRITRMKAHAGDMTSALKKLGKVISNAQL